ncbi:MAG TPA: hypothetical protein VNC61_00750 [Acidimicrobiales bacterium]|nr:hypothetical protein [Acidimicrobiales bacterium]
MATQRTSFNKLQRDRDKQEKAAAKRDRRQSRATATDGEQVPGESVVTGNEPSAQELLDEVEKVHRQFDAGDIDFETYENTKTLLLSQLPVD